MTVPLYVPQLKAHEADFGVLPRLPADVQDAIKPTFVTGPQTKTMPAEKLAKVLATRAQRQLGRSLLVQPAWPFFLDCSNSFSGHEDCDARAFEIWNYLSERGVKFTPVVDTNLLQSLRKDLGGFLAHKADGVCLKLDLKGAIGPVTAKPLRDFVDRLVLHAGPLDILIDCGEIREGHVSHYAELLAVVCEVLPEIVPVRNLIFSGSSFPISISDIKKFGIDHYSRFEYRVWKEAMRYRAAKRLIFGDFGPAHMNFEPRYIPNKFHHGNVRYTGENSYWVYRGTPDTKRNPRQYAQLCAKLVKHAEFRGRDYSAAEALIEDTASTKRLPDSARIWAIAAYIQHLTYVARGMRKESVSIREAA